MIQSQFGQKYLINFQRNFYLVRNPFLIHSKFIQIYSFQEVSEDQLRALEKQRQEHKLGILLVAISILFILCQSFKMIPDLYEIMYCESIDK